METKHVAGIILAGGLGTRMGGKRKALLEVGGRSLLQRQIAVYELIFKEIVIAVRESEPFERFGLPVALDRFEARSSLTGIHAGLASVQAEHAFVAACDVPFLSEGLVRALIREAQDTDDVIVPRKEDGYGEPLCAIYSKRCLPHIEEQLGRGDFKIINFFDKVHVRDVSVRLLAQHDPDLLSFRNLNTPEELARARELAEKKGL